MRRGPFTCPIRLPRYALPGYCHLIASGSPLFLIFSLVSSAKGTMCKCVLTLIDHTSVQIRSWVILCSSLNVYICGSHSCLWFALRAGKTAWLLAFFCGWLFTWIGDWFFVPGITAGNRHCLMSYHARADLMLIWGGKKGYLSSVDILEFACVFIFFLPFTAHSSAPLICLEKIIDTLIHKLSSLLGLHINSD